MSQAEGADVTLTIYFGGPGHLTAHLATGHLLVGGRRVVRADVICERSRQRGWAPVNGPFLQLEPRRTRKVTEGPYDFVSSGPLAKAFVRDVVDAVIIDWLDHRADVRALIAERAAAATVRRERQAERKAADAHRRQQERLAAAEAEYRELTGHPPPPEEGTARARLQRAQRGTTAQLSIL